MSDGGLPWTAQGLVPEDQHLLAPAEAIKRGALRDRLLRPHPAPWLPTAVRVALWGRREPRYGRPPVQWLSPGELARTGYKAAQASMFGEFADKRDVEAAFPAEFYDFTSTALNADGEFWMDYVADIGDGFDATYAVASAIATVPEAQRGRLLILGGDEVYPTASTRNYTERTTGPYRAALPLRADDSPAVLAIPGNHDWYDGLSAFLRVFCQSWLQDPASRTAGSGPLRRVDAADRTNEFMGGWRTLQSRSYFAAKLPHGWWLWGVDIQFETFIDAPQLAYFMEAATKLGPDDDVILCVAKPSWVDRSNTDHSKKVPDTDALETLCWFIATMFKDRPGTVRVLLSGDKHHYARYTPPDPTTDAPAALVTAGGGGAYTSGTHHLPPRLDHDFAWPRDEPTRYDLEATYPTADGGSQALANQFWRVPWRNPKFARLVGTMQLILVWLVAAAMGPADAGLAQRLREFDLTAIDPSPLALPALVFALLVLAGTVGLAMPSPSSPGLVKRITLGATHGVVQIAVALALTWLLTRVDASVLSPFWFSVAFVVVGLIVFSVVGGHVAAVYLRVADLVKVNSNELFAGMGHDGHKCYLRLRVDADGLTIVPMKLVSAPTRWTPDDTSGNRAPLLVPKRGPVTPELIEQPFTIPRRSTTAGRWAAGDDAATGPV